MLNVFRIKPKRNVTNWYIADWIWDELTVHVASQVISQVFDHTSNCFLETSNISENIITLARQEIKKVYGTS